MFMPCRWVQIGCSVAKWSSCPKCSLALGGEGAVTCDDAGERVAVNSQRTPKWSERAAPSPAGAGCRRGSVTPVERALPYRRMALARAVLASS